MKSNKSYFQGLKNIELYILLFIISIFCATIVYIYYYKSLLKEDFVSITEKTYRLEFYYNDKCGNREISYSNINDIKCLIYKKIWNNISKNQNYLNNFVFDANNNTYNKNNYSNFPTSFPAIILVDISKKNKPEIINNIDYGYHGSNEVQELQNAINDKNDTKIYNYGLQNIKHKLDDIIIKKPMQWRCIPDISNFPLRLNVNNDIECMSKDGNNCINDTAECEYSLNHNNINKLTCGTDHKNKWGSTGYDNVNHWCYITCNRLNCGKI